MGVGLQSGNAEDFGTQTPEIVEWIKSRLGAGDPEIQVKFDDGIITLEGSVRTLAAKRDAGDLALAVRGVRSVANALTIDAPQQPDGVVESSARQRLAAHGIFSETPVSAEAFSGVLHLGGSVPSTAHRTLAEEIVEQIYGVRAVINEITIAADPTLNLAEVEKIVQSRLRNDLWLEGYPITVEATDSAIILSGALPSNPLKARAAHLATVRGVQSVDTSGVEISPGTKPVRLERTETSMGDDRLKAILYENFFQNPLLSSSAIGIKVEGGKVTLEGAVATSSAKRAATDSAMATVGVSEVENRLRIEPPVVITDSKLRENARDALESGMVTEAGSYDLSVARGIVTLNGSVPTAYTRSAAEDLVHRLSGVREVENYLTVEPPKFSENANRSLDLERQDGGSNNEIAASVRDQLFWSPFVDSDTITVSVNEGVVTLDGTVSSAGEKRSAETNAREGGAVAIINNLVIE